MRFNIKTTLIFLSLFLLGFLLFSYHLQKDLLAIYNRDESIKISDREGEEIALLPNEKGNFARYLDEIPPRFKELLIKKEDKLFYYHFGFNPWSIFQASLNRLGLSQRKASSTISQQLVKILLGKEKERSLKNKIIESFYTLALEIYQPKEKILRMYVNSVYFGNQAQGIVEASQLYFKTAPEMLSDGQILQLLATISNPNEKNPAQRKNKESALVLAKNLKLKGDLLTDNYSTVKENMESYSHFSKSYFEISSFLNGNLKDGLLTIDENLSEKIREIVKRNIDDLKQKNAKNAAIIIIKLPENELLALIGSPDPESFEEGYKINMLNEARPIGSTVKPFIYLEAFEKGLRPYTLVDDREYKYITALGFPLYPKNFDYKYRGEVNLHYALSNSLNVPAVKVLEYIGLVDFYQFLEKDLELKPFQNLENYQLGIALGSLEMSLLDLAKYFTIFPNNGILKELRIHQNETQPEKIISKPEYIQLVNKILSDRETGIEQFGLKSDLNLFQKNYAVKTGTSRDFKDSWVIGYTPDFLVGVWVGNADNSPTDEISGQLGAGKIWADTMELLFNSNYNKKTPFEFNLIKDFKNGENIEYGLRGDDFEKSQNALKENDNSLILNPHDGDVYLLEKETKIILEAKEKVSWFVNDEFLGYSEKEIFIPKETGNLKIRVETQNGQKEEILIFIFS